MRNERLQVLWRRSGHRAQPILEARHGDRETVIGVGFQHVIDGAGIECVDRVLVECRDEYDMAVNFFASSDIFCHLNSGHLRHLNIQKGEPRLMLKNGFQCGFAVAHIRQNLQLGP